MSLKAKARADAGRNPDQGFTPSESTQAFAAQQNHRAGIPMNGNPVHDMQTVGGMGFTLAKAPVVRELRNVQKNYPQWQLPSLVCYSLIRAVFVDS